MEVAIDVAPLARTRAGTARYLTGLLGGLQNVPDLNVRTLPARWGATAAGDLVWYPLVLPYRARGADVLHCLGVRAPLRASVPLVVTVHDVAFLRHPETFPRWSRTFSALAFPRVVRAAARLIAPSEFTRNEIVELLRVPAERITVVPGAAEGEFSPDGPPADGDYVLAVGTLEPRKNLARMAEAARRAGVELCVVGERGWGGVDANLDGVRWLGRVPDAELARLYRGARCVVYASLYEGFGLPVLEAMACGAPVVTSANGATAEVADGAAVLVDPLDPEAISAGIVEALARREELRGRGLKRARAFSWAAAAEATVAVYREVVE